MSSGLSTCSRTPGDSGHHRGRKVPDPASTATATRAAYKRPHGVRHLLAGYDLSTDRLYGHVVPRKGRTEFLALRRYVRSLHPPQVRSADRVGQLQSAPVHPDREQGRRLGSGQQRQLAYAPFHGSWLNWIEPQFTALRYFALDGTDHPSRREQASMIRRYIAWRNCHAHDHALRELVKRANVA